MNELRYYVYELVDPRNGIGFYIGKGTGDRWKQHMRKSKLKGKRNAGNFLKTDIIESIHAAGLNVQCRKLARFRYELDAYLFERKLIADAFNEGRVIANYNDGISAEKLLRRFS